MGNGPLQANCSIVEHVPVPFSHHSSALLKLLPGVQYQWVHGEDSMGGQFAWQLVFLQKNLYCCDFIIWAVENQARDHIAEFTTEKTVSQQFLTLYGAGGTMSP